MGPKRVCDDRKNAFQRIKYVYAKMMVLFPSPAEHGW